MDPYIDFKVDNFYANKKNVYTFFLTHMHEGIILKFKFRPLERTNCKQRFFFLCAR